MAWSRDTELNARISHVLAQLSRLSEVTAAQIGRSSPSAESERQIPRGVDDRKRRADRPPSRDRSIYDFYAWHFARAMTDHERRLFVYLAESDLAQRTHRMPDSRKARQPSPEDRNARILMWYEGLDPLQAAIAESTHAGYCSEANIRKVRRDAYPARDPATGHRLEGWAGWTDDERLTEISKLQRRGIRKAGRIADELGTSPWAVQRYLKGYRRRAA